jgi:hypothetical protein
MNEASFTHAACSRQLNSKLGDSRNKGDIALTIPRPHDDASDTAPGVMLSNDKGRRGMALGVEMSDGAL